MIYLHQKASIIQNDQDILTTKLYKEKITLLPYLPVFSPPPSLCSHVVSDHKLGS